MIEKHVNQAWVSTIARKKLNVLAKQKTFSFLKAENLRMLLTTNFACFKTIVNCIIECIYFWHLGTCTCTNVMKIAIHVVQSCISKHLWIVFEQHHMNMCSTCTQKNSLKLHCEYHCYNILHTFSLYATIYFNSDVKTQIYRVYVDIKFKVISVYIYIQNVIGVRFFSNFYNWHWKLEQ